jgi:hypothetical protein
MLLRKVRPHFRTRCWDSCTSKVVTNARQEKLWFQFSRCNTTRSAKYVLYTTGLNPECKKIVFNQLVLYFTTFAIQLRSQLETRKLRKRKIEAIPKEYLYLYKYFVDVNLVPSHLRLLMIDMDRTCEVKNPKCECQLFQNRD